MSSINALLVETLPHLQRYAWHLTRNRDDAEDLVQDCVERALMKSELFERGTSLRAWMFTMMRNLFINGARHRSVTDKYAAGVQLRGDQSQAPSQHDAVMLSRTFEAIESLSEEEREAVLLLGARQLSYHEVAADSGLPIGTMKSRLSRGRSKLRSRVMGEAGATRPRA